MYLVLAMIGGIVGGLLSMGMRLESMEPGMQIFGNPRNVQRFVTAHGLIMVFFMVMPATMGGFGNWMVPLMIGAPTWPSRAEQHLLLAGGPAFVLLRHLLVRAWTSRDQSGLAGGGTLYAPLSNQGPTHSGPRWTC